MDGTAVELTTPEGAGGSVVGTTVYETELPCAFVFVITT